MVLLDLVVRDKKGRTVGDLQPSEVEVFEDGAQCELLFFRFAGSAARLGPGPRRDRRDPAAKGTRVPSREQEVTRAANSGRGDSRRPPADAGWLARGRRTPRAAGRASGAERVRRPLRRGRPRPARAPGAGGFRADPVAALRGRRRRRSRPARARPAGTQPLPGSWASACRRGTR